MTFYTKLSNFFLVSKILSIFLLLTGLILTCLVLHRVDKFVQQSSTDLHKLVVDGDNGVAKLSANLADLQLVISLEREAQKNQTREFQKTIADVHDLVIHTDLKLNGSKNILGVLPQIQGLLLRTDNNLNEQLIPTTNHAVQALTLDVHDTLNATNSMLNSITADADDLHARLSDPAVPELMGHINVLALHLDNIAANSEAMSSDMRGAVHRLAQPPTKFHEFLDASWTILRFGSLFATP